ncbi:hypothetical protein K503DRAFT_774637 [Rhizopogon vinicolor AM-OR11-026]|uniref:Uncharacterized protein n=1 Tax=Rhizopogon vinicolor AM-OR11-026 TaxID=1314800 RepID=A0A1B7MP51_9AGAM|nr:hypothetical protein K503DRAFT_774637 [Rhizopogon vinicolor AM-OR11-026]
MTPANSSAKTELQGLKLANDLFAPLLNPIAGTQSAWNNYSINRLRTTIENGTLLSKSSEEDEEDEDEYDEDNMPRSVDSFVRIYSLASPTYIDVHLRYYCRPRYSEVEWFYTLGYKIQRRPPGKAANVSAIKKEFIEGPPPIVHTRNGWQTLCWGYFDDSNGNYGSNWRCIELGEVEMNQEGAVDVYETLFGELEKPAIGSKAELAYRRSLVRGMRLLLAAAGISYEVACTNDEMDRRPRDYMLEGLSDKWVARGIRNACGFQLKRDAEEARKGAQKREEQGGGHMYSEDEDDEDDSSF